MKILIVGIVASGKTTIASQLSKKIGIPWYELDCIAHPKNKGARNKASIDEQRKAIEMIDRSGSWIFEGVYRKSYHNLFEMADRIIFLDPPLYVRYYRIIRRYLKQKLGIESCHYKSDLKMLRNMFRWTKTYEDSKSDFEEILRPYKEKVKVMKGVENMDTVYNVL